MMPGTAAIQKRLDAWATWHNLHRPHEALVRLTPSEAALGFSLSEPLQYTERGELEPASQIRRQHVGDDPRLLYRVIRVRPKHRSAA